MGKSKKRQKNPWRSLRGGVLFYKGPAADMKLLIGVQKKLKRKVEH